MSDDRDPRDDWAADDAFFHDIWSDVDPLDEWEADDDAEDASDPNADDGESCPRCGAAARPVGGSAESLQRCTACGTYFELDDAADGSWDRSSRYRTRLNNDWEP